MTTKLLGATVAALATVVLAAGPAEAQRRDGWAGAAYDAGYRDGVRAGGDDGRDRRPFDYQRHRDYRAADRGYSTRNGRRDDWARDYRAGFVAGYRDGYYSGGGGRGEVRRGPWNGPPVRGARRSSNLPGVSDDIGYANGFEEGYQRGVDDGRDRDRYDPRRHRRYRDADRGYRRDYGPKAIYETSYRRGFERGYDQGYADGQRRRSAWRR
ncbi:MAG: hypothetical protein AB7U83_16755 [Vicinamibacterales bacterium]